MARRITIKDIAREADVHHATVSRALRGSLSVSPETAQRIKEAAARLGYEPDPMMAALAAYRKTTQPVSFKETLAFLWPEQTRGEVASSLYYRRSIEGAAARAKELGYVLDEFHLCDASPKAFSRVLEARGIRGLIIGGYNRLTAAHLRFPIDKLAVVAMTASLKSPRLHRVEHDHFTGMRIALHELKRRGFSRIAFLTGERQDRVLERRYSASFLMHHPLGLESARELLEVVAVPGLDQMRAMVKRTKADCLLMTFTPTEADGVTVGRKTVPVFSLDLLPGDKRHSGIYQQMEQVAANAVDMVVEQLMHGRRGVPASCKTVLTAGKWIDATGG